MGRPRYWSDNALTVSEAKKKYGKDPYFQEVLKLGKSDGYRVWRPHKGFISDQKLPGLAQRDYQGKRKVQMITPSGKFNEKAFKEYVKYRDFQSAFEDRAKNAAQARSDAFASDFSRDGAQAGAGADARDYSSYQVLSLSDLNKTDRSNKAASQEILDVYGSDPYFADFLKAGNGATIRVRSGKSTKVIPNYENFINYAQERAVQDATQARIDAANPPAEEAPTTDEVISSGGTLQEIIDSGASEQDIIDAFLSGTTQGTLGELSNAGSTDSQQGGSSAELLDTFTDNLDFQGIDTSGGSGAGSVSEGLTGSLQGLIGGLVGSFGNAAAAAGAEGVYEDFLQSSLPGSDGQIISDFLEEAGITQGTLGQVSDGDASPVFDYSDMSSGGINTSGANQPVVVNGIEGISGTSGTSGGQGQQGLFDYSAMGSPNGTGAISGSITGLPDGQTTQADPSGGTINLAGSIYDYSGNFLGLDPNLVNINGSLYDRSGNYVGLAGEDATGQIIGGASSSNPIFDDQTAAQALAAANAAEAVELMDAGYGRYNAAVRKLGIIGRQGEEYAPLILDQLRMAEMEAAQPQFAAFGFGENPMLGGMPQIGVQGVQGNVGGQSALSALSNAGLNQLQVAQQPYNRIALPDIDDSGQPISQVNNPTIFRASTSV